MYEVKLINDSVETIINAASTDLGAPRITGKLKFGINTIDSFQFKISPNNIGYNSLYALSTLVEVFNTKTNKTEFKGRVLLPRHILSENGNIEKTVICESELGFLMDSTQRYGEYHNVGVREFFEIIISNHNRQVSEDKKFAVGTVDVVDSNDSLYRFLGYEKTLDTIKDKLIDRLGGELRVRWSNGIRYLDYMQQLGYVSSTEIRLSKNLKSLTEEKDPSQIISRLVPLGAKIKKIEVDENGNETEIDTEERLTISSVNNGLDYLDDIEAIEQFGIVEGSVEFDDVNIPDILLRKGQEYQSNTNRLKKKYSIGYLDLFLIGIDFQSVDMYNYYPVINPIMDIYENLRVIEKTIDIENPHNSSINVGDKFDDIKQYQLSIKKTADTVKEVSSKVNNTINKVNGVENNIVNIGKDIGELTGALDGNIGNTEEIANVVSTLATMVTDNKSRIDSVESDISTIKTDISTIKNNISTVNTNIAAIKSDISTIKTDILSINTKLNKIDTLDTKLDDIISILNTQGGIS